MKRKLNIKRLILCFIILIIIVGCALIGLFFSKLSKVENTTELIKYEVSLGKTTYEVYEDLENEGIIKSAKYLKIYSKLIGNFNVDAGTYELSKGYSSIKIYNILKQKNTVEKQGIKFTFNEGKTIKDLAKTISSTINESEENVLSIINDKEYIQELINKYWFLTDDILNDNIYYSLEGYLFPETYMIDVDATTKDIIEILLNQMDKELSKYKNDIESNELSIHEIITLASILESEVGNTEQIKSIAGLFVNRINDGWNLGSDVTTYYGLGLALHERDLYQYEIDDCSNKYNTRCASLIGLPVGPVCNPGIKTIEAAINPEENDYYYFVSDKNYKLYFSKTNSEHLNTIYRLQSEGLWYEH